MAQYKVPQNVESEDKILGPLSLKQFIYVIIALMWGFLMWRIFIKAPVIAVFAALPVSGVFLALGLIQREEQSFENYFIAMVRFILVPRKRVWHKDDIQNVFARPEPVKKATPTLQRDPDQVKGQLEKLALIVDTRGRVAKSPEIQLPDEANQASQIAARVNFTDNDMSHNQGVQAQVTVNDDILDMQNNAAAVNVGHLLENVESSIRDHAKELMHDPKQAPKAQPASPPKSSDDILNVTANSGSLSVAQIAKNANRNQQTLSENQSVQLR